MEGVKVNNDDALRRQMKQVLLENGWVQHPHADYKLIHPSYPGITAACVSRPAKTMYCLCIEKSQIYNYDATTYEEVVPIIQGMVMRRLVAMRKEYDDLLTCLGMGFSCTGEGS